jgi:MFS family permease
MVIYTAATAVAGFAQDITTLLTIRTIQGIVIANTPIALKIIIDQFPKGKFSIGQSIVTSAYSGGMAIGVVLGPIIADTIGWQSIFFMCAPIAAVLLFMCWRVLPIDESVKILENGTPSASDIEVGRKEDVIDKNGVDEKKKGKLALDVKGIITPSLSLVSFLVAVTNSSSLLEDPLGFAVPIIIGAISLVLFILVEKRAESPLVPLKLLLQPPIFAGNIAMLMFGIIQYIIITAIPQLDAAPQGSGLGLDPDLVGLLQLPLSLAVLIFGPVFGLLLAKRRKLNTKLLIPSMVIMAVSFLIVTIFHDTSADVTAALFLFGIDAGLLPVTLINIIIALTPRELTGIFSAATSDMRIIGGAIGPVIATVIISSIPIPIEVDGTTNQYPSPTAFNIVFIVGLALAIVATILVVLMRGPALNALNRSEIRQM